MKKGVAGGSRARALLYAAMHLLDSSGSPKVEIFFFLPSGSVGLDCGSGDGQS